MNTDDEFASVILVKRNFVEVLERELDRPHWQREHVAFGTATDPYQPIEGQYQLTRRAIEVLARGRTPISLITKGPMVVRDIDVLLALGRSAASTVYMSVPTVDEDAWRTLEPGTAHPLQRLRAVKELSKAGVEVGVLMAPIVPGFSSSWTKVERTVKAIAEHGARFVGCNVMHLEDGTRTHFMGFIKKEFPHLLPRFERLYARKHAPEAYRREVRAMVGVLQRRYGLDARDEDPKTSEQQTDSSCPEQVGFAW
jgi:DNA repair photolyase